LSRIFIAYFKGKKERAVTTIGRSFYERQRYFVAVSVKNSLEQVAGYFLTPLP